MLAQTFVHLLSPACGLAGQLSHFLNGLLVMDKALDHKGHVLSNVPTGHRLRPIMAFQYALTMTGLVRCPTWVGL